MKKQFLTTVRTGIITGLFITIINSCLQAQQHVIANIDNTRPEIKRTNTIPSFITSFHAKKWNGYNEIRWTAANQHDTRKYVVEYSTDGINYQSAGEAMVDNNMSYVIKHHILDERPALYRIRFEQLNNSHFYSSSIFLDGIPVSPVQVYPTVITGNTVNIISAWPMERMNVYASNGAQVYSKEIAGQRDNMTVILPSLSRGMYWVHFHGKDWKVTEKIVIQ